MRVGVKVWVYPKAKFRLFAGPDVMFVGFGSKLPPRNVMFCQSYRKKSRTLSPMF